MTNGNAVNIIGAGLAGLSAARTLAAAGVHVRLFSVQASERAQSNLAEGGINAALNVMGEDDSPREHFNDTLKGGCDLADPNMVRNLTQAAPGVVRDLAALGVPFHREDGHLIQRNFGGQKKKRTAYAKSSTGKVLTAALIDAVRRYEAQGPAERYPHHRFERLLFEGETLRGVQVRDVYSDEVLMFRGPVLMACGGMNGLLPGATTGTSANTGSAAAALFVQGAAFGNLEFLQYHPTTAAITGKRLLISEAARGEGGRLFVYRDETGREPAERCYFMEEKAGPHGNLMPRDVISREMARLGKQAYLDLTGIPEETWEKKLPDLREEVMHYLGLDPAREPVPVSPGIHFFMGGILTDEQHRTNIPHLYAAGECACAYHGANRLGGNSLLGAVYGGETAAKTILREEDPGEDVPAGGEGMPGPGEGMPARQESLTYLRPDEEEKVRRMGEILMEGLPVLRSEKTISAALDQIRSMDISGASDDLKARRQLALAMLESALARKESRGAHTRLDYPGQTEEYRKTTRAQLRDGRIEITFEAIPELRQQEL